MLRSASRPSQAFERRVSHLSLSGLIRPSHQSVNPYFSLGSSGPLAVESRVPADRSIGAASVPGTGDQRHHHTQKGACWRSPPREATSHGKWSNRHEGKKRGGRRIEGRSPLDTHTLTNKYSIVVLWPAKVMSRRRGAAPNAVKLLLAMGAGVASESHAHAREGRSINRWRRLLPPRTHTYGLFRNTLKKNAVPHQSRAPSQPASRDTLRRSRQPPATATLSRVDVPAHTGCVTAPTHESDCRQLLAQPPALGLRHLLVSPLASRAGQTRMHGHKTVLFLGLGWT